MPKVVPEYKEEARNRILTATLKTLLAKGYSKTTMNDIAEEVGVSKAAIYQYYDSKESLMKAATGYMVETVKSKVWHRKYSENIREISSPEFYQRIYDLSSSFMPEYFMFMVTQAASGDQPSDDLMSIYYTMVEFFEGVTDDLISRGVIKPDADKESLVIGVMALQDGLTLAEKMGVDPAKVRKAWSYILNQVMDSLTP
jgi:AcrR family transcriptional regulator